MFKLKKEIKKSGLMYKDIYEALNISRQTLDHWDALDSHPTVIQFYDISVLLNIDFCILKIRIYG